MGALFAAVNTAACTASYQDVDVLELLDGFRLDRTPGWASPLESPRVSDLETPVSPRTIKIFLASSSELHADRDEFDLYFRQQNDRWRKRGIYLEIIRCENFLDALSETRLQNEYNKALRECDIFVSLFFIRIGSFTEEEFATAHSLIYRVGTLGAVYDCACFVDSTEGARS